MSQNPQDYLSMIANLFSVIVAVAALGFAVYSQKLAAKQFNDGAKLQEAQFNERVKLQEKIATANVRPLLTVGQSPRATVAEAINVVLFNDGLGPAAIKKVTFTRGKATGRSIPSVLDAPDHPRSYSWDAYKEFSDAGTYLRHGENFVLAALTLNNLKAQGFYGNTGQALIFDVENAIRGIKISIEFEDILGHKQPNFEATLS